MPRRTQANNKTQSHDASVEAYLADVANPGRREDAFTLLNMMCEITSESARMWGSTIVGFGSYHYVYATGREGDHCLTGFAPRKASLVGGPLGMFQHSGIISMIISFASR